MHFAHAGQATGEYSLRAQKLFHHPVGIFSFGARWYLASLAVLVLILVAVHFVIQIQVQEQARHLMRQWLGKSHITVGQIRYHLLRNALTLQRIRVQRGNDFLAIGQALVSADAESLTSEVPRLGRVALSGVVAEIRDFNAKNSLQNDVILGRILHAVESLQFNHGLFILYAAGESSPPLEFEAVSFHQQRIKGMLSMQASAELYGAPVRAELALPVQAGVADMRGSMAWQGVEADALMASMGWQNLAGLVDGEVSFQEGPVEGAGKEGSDVNFAGHVHVVAEEDAGDHSLRINGTRKSGRWQLDVAAEAWPLSPWTRLLPPVSGQRLLTAQWKGGMHLSERQGEWQGRSSEGMLQHVSWQEDTGERASSQLEQFIYKGLTWNGATRRARIDESTLQGLDLMVHPGADSKASEDGWRFSVQKFQLKDVRLGLALERGELVFAPLQGQGSISEQGVMGFRLESETETDNAPSDRGGWVLTGNLGVQRGQWHNGGVLLKGNDVPLQQLRAAIPLGGTQESPLGLEGLVSVSAEAVVDRGHWQLNGKANIEQLALSHTDDRWLADRVQVEFGPVGPFLPSQLISKVDIRGWNYTAALHPLSGDIAADSIETEESRGPYWAASLLRNNNWVIQSMLCSDGSISVGREDSYWATGLQLQLQDVQAGKWAKVTLQGNVDGGLLNAKGKWTPLADHPAYGIKAELAHANPFFLRDWLQASGMPPLVRGRISGQLLVDSKDDGHYQANMRIRLDRAKTEAVVSPNDPLLGRMGYGLADILARLDNGKGRISSVFDVQGDWEHAPLSMRRLGLALEKSLLGSMKKGSMMSFAKQPEALHAARVRLHARGGLSHNERTRLRKLWRQLRDHRTWVVDLEPVWTAGATLDGELVQRIRYTQGLIEGFMHDRNISTGRIYPQWPLQQSRTQDPAFIRVLIRPAG